METGRMEAQAPWRHVLQGLVAAVWMALAVGASGLTPDTPGVLSNSSRTLEALTGLDAPPAILLENAILETSVSRRGLAIPKAYRATEDTTIFIVQFDERITPAVWQQIADLGGKVLHYVPRDAFAVQGSSEVRAALGAAENVIHLEPYHPYFKLSRDLVAYAAGARDERTRGRAEAGRYHVLMFRGVKGRAQVASLGIATESMRSLGDRELLTVSCTPDKVTDLVRTECVQWVEPALPYRALNDLANVATAAAAYKQQHPTLDGSGVTVAIADTGVDFTHRGFSVDPSLATDLTNNTRIVYYEARTGGPTADGVLGDNQGHGTHVAGTVLGNGAWSDTSVLVPGSGSAPYDARQFAGIAPGAGLVVLEDFNSFTDDELARTAYQQGARISNNSWGNALYQYGTLSAIWDQLVRDADFSQAGDQELVVFFAAGNSGAGQADGTGGSAGTIGSPGNAKNVITVGAVEQLRHATNHPGSSLQTDSDWQVASASSRGPVSPTDARIKPDIVAPGTYVISAQTKDRDFDTDSNPLHFEFDLRTNNVNTATHYAFLGGTSTACAAATGCGALLFEYLEGLLGRVPSPAMMKAALVGGSRRLNTSMYRYAPLGSAPSIVHEGWGMVDVMGSIGGDCHPLFLDQLDTTPLGTGEVFTRQVTVEEGGELKVTLAWTDEPGMPGVGVQLINNLDVGVVTPDGSRYVGNLFETSGVYSLVVETNTVRSDWFNNVEVIVLPNTTQGVYTVEVYGQSIPVGPQDYALVISGAVRCDEDGDCLDTDQESSAGTSPDSSDTDGDGMWDGWEWAFSTNNAVLTNMNFMDPLDDGIDHMGTTTPGDGDPAQLPSGDVDGDGATNFEEFSWWLASTGSSCNVAETSPDPTNPDTDGDGMVDGWEIAYLLNPLVDDAGEDADMDSVANGLEYRAGTDPRDATSFFQVHLPRLDAGGPSMLIEWASVSGKFYAVTRASSATDNFVPLDEGIPAAPPANTYTDSVEGVEAGFYRVEVE